MKGLKRILVGIDVLFFLFVILLTPSCNKVAFSGATVSALGITPTNPIPPISCTVGANGPALTRDYPTSCLTDPLLLPTSSGFEMNNLTNSHVTLAADNSTTGTQNGVYLYVEIASYEQPDTIIINAISNTGQTTELLYICNYSTDTQTDPTNPHGKVRPFSDTILQFSVWLPAGTSSLNFSVDENTPYNSGSPTYIGVWNLNEFTNSIQQAQTSGLGTDSSYNFRPQSAPLNQYNDQLDKHNPSYPNYCIGSP